MKMKKNCELCKGLARMHCESDQASLCWSCDFKVHSANFLVARHSRTLLCHVCQSPTPWTASGSKVGPTVSVCVGCVKNFDKINHEGESRAANDNEGNETEVESGNMDDEGYATEEEDEEEDDNEEDDENADDEDIENEDNQVVPWSPSTPPPPSAASSSSNGEEESYFSSSSSSSSSQRHRKEAQRKRTREITSDLRFNVNNGCTTSQENPNSPPATAVDGGERGEERGAGSVTSVDSLSPLEVNILKRRKIQCSNCRLSKLREDPSAVDHDSSESS